MLAAILAGSGALAHSTRGSAAQESVRREVVAAGGLLFVSAQHGLAEVGGARGLPTASAETRRALERLESTLAGAGSSMEQVVATTVYVKHASDLDAVDAVYGLAFDADPPARTTVVADLASGALVAMSAVAVPDGVARETLHPTSWPRPVSPVSFAVRAGDLVFVSGLVSRRGRDNMPVVGPVATQVRTILDNARAILRAAGLTPDDVVAVRVFLRDDTYFEPMNDEYRKVFGTRPPARATAVTGLPGDASVQMSFIASASPSEVIGPVVAPSLPLSAAVATGPFVFLSGVLGNTATNAGNLDAQSREVLARIGRTLQLVDLSFADVVESTVFTPDLWQAATMNRVLAEFFPVAPPARTVAGVRLTTRAGLIEMMMTAVKRGG
jgi:2-iminobutanoate/2-iminopropanoate deaminase